MSTVAIVQARMGSSRLPGKMMLPLDCTPVIQHIVRRVQRTSTVKRVVVATSGHQRDDILARYGRRAGADVFRGDETDVLARMHEAAAEVDAETIVRICGDTPLMPPEVVDAVVTRLRRADVDYASTMTPRSFPRGIDVEAFTRRSFDEVAERATEPHQREHVTTYYREHPDEFDLANVESREVFEDSDLHDRTDLRLTLDVADDYEVIQKVYRNVEFDDVVPFQEAVRYVDERDLGELNDHVEQVDPIPEDE